MFEMENLISGLTWLDILVRVAIAVLIGLIIGVERELANHPAGMKTHALVCLGAAVASMISVEMCYELMYNEALLGRASVDMSRIASGVVSGIGFIGAGAIIRTKDGSFVTGITTAATVWITGCMGLAIGMGYYKIISIAMVGILFTTIMLKWLEDKFIKNKRIRIIEIITDSKENALPVLEDYFDRKQITVTSFDCTAVTDDEDEDAEVKYCCRYIIRLPKSVHFNMVMRDIARMEETAEVYEAPAKK